MRADPKQTEERQERCGRSNAGRLAFMAVVAAGYALVVRPWMLRWGTTPEERGLSLPGDDLIPAEPAYDVTRAVTIEAQAERVWRWLAQIGQDRAGFYSYSALENLLGARIHNADRVEPAWELHEGDRCASVPEGWLGLPWERWGGRPGWRVLRADGRTLVLENWGTFTIEPLEERRCRLYARSWSIVKRPLVPLLAVGFDPIHFVMERRMLLGIKRRAEREEQEGAAELRVVA